MINLERLKKHIDQHCNVTVTVDEMKEIIIEALKFLRYHLSLSSDKYKNDILKKYFGGEE